MNLAVGLAAYFGFSSGWTLKCNLPVLSDGSGGGGLGCVLLSFPAMMCGSQWSCRDHSSARPKSRWVCTAARAHQSQGGSGRESQQGLAQVQGVCAHVSACSHQREGELRAWHCCRGSGVKGKHPHFQGLGGRTHPNKLSCLSPVGQDTA